MPGQFAPKKYIALGFIPVVLILLLLSFLFGWQSHVNGPTIQTNSNAESQLTNTHSISNFGIVKSLQSRTQGKLELTQDFINERMQFYKANIVNDGRITP